MENLNQIEIDLSGRFKYILIKVIDPGTMEKKYFVRGFKWAAYHENLFDDFETKINSLNLKYECVGGGRIHHEQDENKILVYGYSKEYGKADHKITVHLLKKMYPEHVITYTNQDY